ncbi:MAG: nucleoside triphosphate pyrophosphohydrolase [Lentisphaeria bacterium]|nr:nucleoside triphosphate pyrophosphohydrolase [Lentisphaeria bacterium]
MTDELSNFSRLLDIMSRLRADDGCPWDREQSHDTLKQHLIEEAYELIDAIDDGDDEFIKDELGDVLLQVVFHCQIASEENRFDIDDVSAVISDKLIRRHPHVFGDAKLDSSGQVIKQWDEIKKTETAGASRTSILDGVPKHLPMLGQALKIQKKADKVGFDWSDEKDVVDKIDEELAELKAELVQNDQQAIEDEMGDLLFAVVNLCRFRDVDPEDALRKTIKKFKRRFGHVEASVTKSDKDWKDYNLEELDAYWNEAKKSE